jgi:hypothetical protein
LELFNAIIQEKLKPEPDFNLAYKMFVKLIRKQKDFEWEKFLRCGNKYIDSLLKLIWTDEEM